MFASQYASIVPTSRQYGSSLCRVPTALSSNGWAAACAFLTARGMMSLPKSWLEFGSLMSVSYTHLTLPTKRIV